MPDSKISITEHIDYETFVDIISRIPSCIFFKDTQLRYLFSSHYWVQLSSQDIVGKTDLDIRKDKENAIKAMEADKEIINSKKGCKYTIKSDIDGEINYLELNKEPIIDSKGEVIGIVGLINDITEKTIMEKRIVGMSEMLEVKCNELETTNDELKATLERVEQIHASQKMFTASMNHELRSPLNGIIASLQLLMSDDSLNTEQKSIVESAFASSQTMLGIVNELLDFAKYEIGGYTPKHELFALSTLLGSIEFPMGAWAEKNGLKFTINNNTNHDFLISDDVKIKQIMENLISNATNTSHTKT